MSFITSVKHNTSKCNPNTDNVEQYNVWKALINVRNLILKRINYCKAIRRTHKNSENWFRRSRCQRIWVRLGQTDIATCHMTPAATGKAALNESRSFSRLRKKYLGRLNSIFNNNTRSFIERRSINLYFTQQLPADSFHYSSYVSLGVM
jgi:hypothetical protein